MLLDPSTAQHLKPWLVRTLGPICDAEPAALAEYVLALLKHNLPEQEMRKELSAQLEEFLEKEGPSFIDTLFTVLRTKSYLPYTTSSPPPQPSPSTHYPADTGIPIPLDGLLSNTSPSPERGQKRAHADDDRDALHPAKGSRLTADGQFSRYSSGRDTRSTGQWVPRSDRQGSANGIGPIVLNGQRIQTYQPPDQRRGICRDYHNNGYCARGALCKYSHGDDAFIPSQFFAMGSPGGTIPFLPMFPPGVMPFGMVGPGAAYDPHEARMDMRPGANLLGVNGRAPPRPPVLSRAQDDSSQTARTSGELPVIQDLTPQTPEDLGSQPQPPQDGAAWMQGAPPSQRPEAMDVDTVPSSSHVRTGSGAVRNGPRGDGRGTFSGDAQSFRPERRNDKTLVVEKIPEDKLSLDAVNSWFKRFGTVTNVAIDAPTAKALVSFSDHGEAHAAWKSEDAVFGNRFVKVFWHRPMEGRGQKGTRMLAASAPMVANIAARTSTSTPPASASTTVAARKPVVPPNTATELAAKQKLLEEQIAEQKSLMASLATASGEEKKDIMARLRKLGEEMKPSSSASISGEAASHATSASQRAGSSTGHPSQQEKERERLDRELDLRAATDGESTAELQAKLAKLKEEAASLGIPDSGDYTYGGRSHRPYRGRGGRGSRGGFFRGVGRGASRGSMKLDNRPKKLLVKGVREDVVPALREWYEVVSGQLDSVDSVGDDEVLVSFRTRAAAEQALAKGTDIPSIGTVHISWHSGQQLFPSSQARAASPSQPMPKENGSEEARPPSPISHGHSSTRRQEEEVVASGWGDGGDEDDMGF